jgi:branched-subunit amino acid transport protein
MAGDPTVSEVWLVVAAIGAGTMAVKAAGPVLLGGRPLPARLGGVVALLAPALLAALVTTATFGAGQGLSLDVRLLGVAVAGAALVFRAPVLLVVILAAAAAAVARLIGA